MKKKDDDGKILNVLMGSKRALVRFHFVSCAYSNKLFNIRPHIFKGAVTIDL